MRPSNPHDLLYSDDPWGDAQSPPIFENGSDLLFHVGGISLSTSRVENLRGVSWPLSAFPVAPLVRALFVGRRTRRPRRRAETARIPQEAW